MQKRGWHFAGGDDETIAPPPEVESQFSTSPRRPRKLLDHVRHLMRVNHYAARTEEAYTGWIRRFILYHGKKHPREMGT